MRKNWLEVWKEWCFPISEAPESFLTWAGLSTIASVVKRNVYFPRSYLGSYDIFPFLFVIFVGPPASRKTSALNFTKRVLKRVPSVTIASEAVSDSQFIKFLSETPDGSASILSGEFGVFANVSKEGMFDLLTKFFDADDRHTYSTRKYGNEIVENPCVNLLAATTPEWISTLPRYVIGGGFASRVIFIHETRPRDRAMYYDHIDQSIVESHFLELVKGLGEISQLSGAFKLQDKKTKTFVEDWYRSSIDRPTDPNLEGYQSRKHIHLHKVAMLLSLAESDKLVVGINHFEQALLMLDTIEEKMGRALASVGRNPYSSDLDGVREFVISSASPVSRKTLLARFYRDLTPAELDEILGALVVMGDIKLLSKGDDRSYLASP